MLTEQIARAALLEAVTTLGLLKPESVEELLPALAQCGSEPPRAAALAFRKIDPQVSSERKRQLGLRTNAFLSVRAAELLTSSGELDIVEAFHQTLLRAFFTRLRAERLAQPLLHQDASRLYEGMFSTECGACRRLDGLPATDWLPPQDCEVPGCALGIRQRIDFIAELIRSRDARIEAKVLSSIGTGEPLSLTCQACSTSLRWDGELPPDDSMAACSGCGRYVCDFGTLKAAVRSEIKKLTEAD